ncbi:hypothetical protein E3N88_38696 [Mikania micrantha]|uniref:Uncharacterized protein n=1 Tax=Mikania micrantha TaxID=192012 RepID=A0A5N6LUS0_9ASTR|nr:hypothetical protein E3N88_38696 [Mikania micrantha]
MLGIEYKRNRIIKIEKQEIGPVAVRGDPLAKGVAVREANRELGLPNPITVLAFADANPQSHWNCLTAPPIAPGRPTRQEVGMGAILTNTLPLSCDGHGGRHNCQLRHDPAYNITVLTSYQSILHCNIANSYFKHWMFIAYEKPVLSPTIVLTLLLACFLRKLRHALKDRMLGWSPMHQL